VRRLFVVFSFRSEENLKKFKENNDMEFVSEKKIAVMEVEGTYNKNDIVELFDISFPCYIIYELVESADELVIGKKLHVMDAS